MIANDMLYRILRRDFKSFVRKTFLEIAGGSKYKDNWHVDIICNELKLVMGGEQNKLIINIPPRYMKSIICSVALPAFILGHNPRENIICVSYSDDLAAKMALDCRKVMESSWYKHVFPATRFSKDRKGISDFETSKGGGRYATSVGGTLTGRGGNIIIIDDPIDPRGANSDTIREKTNDWYSNTLISRLDDKEKGKIIVIMQRLHEADFTGHLLEVDSGFKLVKIPVIAEEEEIWKYKNYIGDTIIQKRKPGDVLHSDRESLSKLLEIKKSMGSYTFAGQYQQNPLSRGGNIIKRDWIQKYDYKDLLTGIAEGEINPTRLVQSWDTASKVGEDNDYSVCITYLRVYGPKVKYYLLDVFRDKLEYPDLVKKAKELSKIALNKYSSLSSQLCILVEEMNSGIGLYQELKRQGDYTVYGIKPEQDKMTRLKNVSNLIENGTCLFPQKATWWNDFERELLMAPNSRHDDQCDALSQFLCWEENNTSNLDWLDSV